MTPRGCFDCLDVAAAEQRQAQAVEVEPVCVQSTDADPAAEVAAFVDCSVPSSIEAARPAAKVSGNAWRGGQRQMLRAMSKMLNAELRAARDRASWAVRGPML